MTLSEPATGAAGKEVLLGVATVEGPLTTRVESGENAGKALVEHAVVRQLTVPVVRPGRDRPLTRRVPVELDPSSDPARCGVVAFVQDEATGRIHQAARIGWMEKAGGK